MEIRAMTAADMPGVRDIDAVIESAHYVHIDRIGEGFETSWKMQPRPFREKRMLRHILDDDLAFTIRQIASGNEEGMALVADHDGLIVGAAAAQPDPLAKIYRLIDIRVDSDFRRQGLAQAMLFQIISQARQAEMRAVMAQAPTENYPALEFLTKLNFEPGGLDTLFRTNHDLVKESVTLFMYLVLS